MIVENNSLLCSIFIAVIEFTLADFKAFAMFDSCRVFKVRHSSNSILLPNFIKRNQNKYLLINQ